MPVDNRSYGLAESLQGYPKRYDPRRNGYRVGLGECVSRIKDSHAKSKVIILLTDGSNNAGEIAPVTAAEIAKTFGVRVYTIGVGTKGMAPYPFQTAFGVQYQNIPVEIDEATLKQIASTTGGNISVLRTTPA